MGPRQFDRGRLGLTDGQRDEILKLNTEYKAKTDTLEQEISRLRAELGSNALRLESAISSRFLPKFI